MSEFNNENLKVPLEETDDNEIVIPEDEEVHLKETCDDDSEIDDSNDFKNK